MAIRWTTALCPSCKRLIDVEEIHGQYQFVLHSKKKGGKPCLESGQPMPPIPPPPKGTPSWLK